MISIRRVSTCKMNILKHMIKKEYHRPMSLLETTMNTRDLGGRLCTDGEITKFDQILRSDKQLYPSKKDIKYLTKHGITTIIDMREKEQVIEQPSGFANLEGFEYHNYPIIEGSQIPESVEAVPGSYMKIATSSSVNDILTTIADSDSGVMFNCSAGKDRSGVIAAIILMICEATEEEIVADYMLTLENNKERFKLVRKNHPEIDINIVIPRESYIKDFMDLFKNEFGDVKGYFKSVGLPDEVREKIKNKMKQ